MRQAANKWRLLLCAAVASLTGCGLFGPPDLEVSATLSSATLALDSTIQVTVRATNIGSEAFEVRPYVCPQIFEVRTPQGDLVGPEGVACVAIGLPPLLLEPGESFGAEYEWRGGGQGYPGARLPPGDYVVRGWVEVLGARRVFSEGEAVTVLGEPVP